MYVGLDGFRHGWVAVSIDGRGKSQIEFLCEIAQLSQREFDMGMIDIPIGLPQSGNRDCDKAARMLLGSNCNRVFTGARRPLLDCCHSYEEANRVGQSLRVGEKPGAGVSQQLFCILKKIKEVDVFMRPERQETLRETHPELVFLRLHDNIALQNKHTAAGRAERRKLLDPCIPDVDRLLCERHRTGAKMDDVLDACACALAAMDCFNGAQRVVPTSKCQVDDHKLKMQIWY